MTPEKALLFYGLCLGIVVASIVALFVWRKKGKLTTSLRSLFKFHSTKVILALGALPTIWFELPPDLKASIPSAWMRTLVIVIAIVGVVARAKTQESLSTNKSLPPADEADKNIPS